jgi:hypothetical protein
VMVMAVGVGHEFIAACTEQRRAYFQRCRPREEAMKAGAADAMRTAAEAAKMTVMLLGRRKWNEFHAHLCGD